MRIKVTHNKFSDYKCMNFLTNFQTLKENFSNKQEMGHISFQDIQSIKPGKTAPFVMEQSEALRTQARLSWCKRYGSLPNGVAGYKSVYDKAQGVLLITAVPVEAE